MLWNTFDSGSIITIAGIISGAVGICISACLKSRCKEIDLCCIKCLRDTQAEEEEAIEAMHIPPPSQQI